MPPDNLTNIIDSLTELKRMYQLNSELLEQLAVTCDWLQSSGVQLPNQNKFNSLLNKAVALLNEIQADNQVLLQYNTSRRKVTDLTRKEETDEEGTVPGCNEIFWFCIGLLLCQGDPTPYRFLQ